MPLFTRQKPESFGAHRAGLGEVVSLATSPDNPLSDQFTYPVNMVKPKDFVRYLIACQVRQYHQTILDQPTKLTHAILVAHAKLLLKKYSPELIIRATLYASQICSRPFSWKFVAEHAIPEVESRCPSLLTKVSPA